MYQKAGPKFNSTNQNIYEIFITPPRAFVLVLAVSFALTTFR